MLLVSCPSLPSAHHLPKTRREHAVGRTRDGAQDRRRVLEHGVGLEERQHEEERVAPVLRDGVVRRREKAQCWRDPRVGVVAVVDRQDQLFEVVGALGTSGRFPHLLDGGQEQADEDGDDGDHHQQLNQRKTGPGTALKHGKPPR